MEREEKRGRRKPKRERGVTVVRRCICDKKFQEKDFFFRFRGMISWDKRKERIPNKRH